MKKRIVWLLLSCLMVVALVLVSCGPSVTEEEEAVVEEEAEPPTTLQVYRDTEHGFSIEYPEGWTENTQGSGAQFSIDFQDPEGRLTASVYLQYECQEITRADFVSEGKAYMESMPQYRLISERDLPVGEGISGHEIVAKGDFGTGTVETFRFLLLVRGRQGIWVGVRGAPTDFDEQQQIVDAIVDSFKLLPTFTFVPPEPWPGGTYTGAGFTITFPAGWCQYPPVRPEHVLHFVAPERSPSVHISPTHRPEDTTLDEYVDAALKSFPDYWASFSLISRRRVTLGGAPAFEIVFTGMSDLSPGYTLKCKYLVVLDEAQAFWVMAATDPSIFAQHEPVINEVIYSFRLR